MTNTEVTVESVPSGASQALLRDFRTGKWRDDEFLWEIAVWFNWADKRLAYFVTAHSDVEERTASSQDEWTLRLLDAAVTAASKGQLSAFRENDLTRYLRKTAEIGGKPRSVTVAGAFLAKLDQEHALDRQARLSFEHTVDQVRSGVRSLPYSTAGEIFSSLALLERMLERGFLGHEYGWYREKVSGIRGYVSDLARRKNRSHPGFQSGLEYINSNLFSFSPPIAWRERPPVLSREELERYAVA